jgi:hypothetical protein
MDGCRDSELSMVGTLRAACCAATCILTAVLALVLPVLIM